jgi:SpoVK/Ycf46/Vps4 family AAA+-type ATPase
MSPNQDTIATLRQAVSQSPANVPLRQHFAETLMGLGQFQEAEKEFRETLQLAPDSTPLKLGLVRAFFQQGKVSAALALIESLIQTADSSAQTYVLYARLLQSSGESEQALNAYRKAMELDTSAADASLAAELRYRPETAERQEEYGRMREPVEEAEVPPEPELERPATTFKDVGGMEKVKEEISMKIIYPLTHPEIYAAYGKKIGGGILLYGPPGCGKTHLARATAGEIKASFMAVGIHDVLDMWIGQSERNLHDIFQNARTHKPCVLFFDEVDALGASRTDMRKSGGRQLINQLLSELDGVAYSNEGILILAATNAPWHLDQAFLRPGRFDRIIFVPPPDAPARAAVLRILTQGKPAQDLDFEQLARKTEEFSGADLKSVVDVGIEQKLREAMKSGQAAPLNTKELLNVIGTLKPTTRDWFATARNYALYANQSGLYDEILAYLKRP